MTYREQVSRTITRLTGRRAPSPPSPLDAWPVDSIFFGWTATNPSLLLGGGTWVRVSEGRFLVGQYSSDVDFDALGDYGGEKNHTLSWSEMVYHSHTATALWVPTKEGNNLTPAPNSTSSTWSNNNDRLATGGGNSGVATTRNWVGGSVDNAGGSAPHNNLPPFLVVYIWRRTA